MNKKISLPVCKVCGQIQAYRIYEVNDNIAIATNRGEHVELLMLLNEFSVQFYYDDIIKMYNSLTKSLIMNGYDKVTRYVAVTYYTLTQLKQPSYPRDYCKFTGAQWKYVARLNKRIMKHFGKLGILTHKDLDEFYIKGELTREEKENLIPILKDWEEKETLTRGLLSAVFYENSSMTQNEACKLFGVSKPRLKRYLKKVR
tara:strand:+ start:9465 stop:10067 length:603 start_codon:yes stop_codon:yes gene_type:complete